MAKVKAVLVHKDTAVISKKAFTLIDGFSSATVQWDYACNEGHGEMAVQAEREYKRAKARLMRYIADLERQVRGED